MPTGPPYDLIVQQGWIDRDHRHRSTAILVVAIAVYRPRHVRGLNSVLAALYSGRRPAGRAISIFDVRRRDSDG